MNSGQNVGDDVTYSGTVAGAMEGALLNVPAIALSQAYNFLDGERTLHWETAETHAPAIVEKLITRPFPAKTLINVNFPNCPADEVQGIRVTSQGAFTHGLFMEMRRDGRGFPYYWLRFGREEVQQKDGADIIAIRERFISVTPLKLDLTHEIFADELRTLF